MTLWPSVASISDAIDGDAKTVPGHAMTIHSRWLAALNGNGVLQRGGQVEPGGDVFGTQPRFVQMREAAHGGQDRVRRGLPQPATAHACDGVGQCFRVGDVR